MGSPISYLKPYSISYRRLSDMIRLLVSRNVYLPVIASYARSQSVGRTALLRCCCLLEGLEQMFTMARLDV